MADEGDIVWSTNGEDFQHNEKYEALESAYTCVDGKWISAKPGDKLYFGKVKAINTNHLIDANDVLEMLGERAWDIAGEFAENYPDVTPKEFKLLDNYLKNWVKKYCKPSFYQVVDVQEYVITEEDIKEQEE